PLRREWRWIPAILRVARVVVVAVDLDDRVDPGQVRRRGAVHQEPLWPALLLHPEAGAAAPEPTRWSDGAGPARSPGRGRRAREIPQGCRRWLSASSSWSGYAQEGDGMTKKPPAARKSNQFRAEEGDVPCRAARTAPPGPTEQAECHH